MQTEWFYNLQNLFFQVCIYIVFSLFETNRKTLFLLEYCNILLLYPHYICTYVLLGQQPQNCYT